MGFGFWKILGLGISSKNLGHLGRFWVLATSLGFGYLGFGLKRFWRSWVLGFKEVYGFGYIKVLGIYGYIGFWVYGYIIGFWVYGFWVCGFIKT